MQNIERKTLEKMSTPTKQFSQPLFNIEPVSNAMSNAIAEKINNKTKPLGSLGMLETVAAQIAAIQQTLMPSIQQPNIVVFAGDHGIAATGLVNPYPQAVTAQMVLNYANGGAAVNVFCKQHNIKLTVVDAGVNFAFDEALSIVHAKIDNGTKNYLEEKAMDVLRMMNALHKGAEIVKDIAEKGCNCIGFGEMGIGNSSSAALIMSAITKTPIAHCVGRGTGANDELLQTKLQTLETVFKKHEADLQSGFDILQCFGGYEIAMMVGAYLKAAELKMIIVVDGFIATSALLIAHQLHVDVLGYCVFAHTSGEQGHERMLHYLNAKPLLNMGMRLGEGSAVALAFPLLQSAVLMMNDMASFASAGVSEANEDKVL
jgi:nicotinate-nucleotide--dimethylbenzimidazole phosphoribosyltransferase